MGEINLGPVTAKPVTKSQSVGIKPKPLTHDDILIFLVDSRPDESNETTYKIRGQTADFIISAVDRRAKAIVLDMYFLSNGIPEVDEKLIAAFKYAKNKGVPIFAAGGLAGKDANGKYILEKPALEKFTRFINTGHIHAEGDNKNGELINPNRTPANISDLKPLSWILAETLSRKKVALKPSNGNIVYSDLNKNTLDKRCIKWSTSKNDKIYNQVNVKGKILFVGGDHKSGDVVSNNEGKPIPGVFELASMFFYFSENMK